MIRFENFFAATCSRNPSSRPSGSLVFIHHSPKMLSQFCPKETLIGDSDSVHNEERDESKKRLDSTNQSFLKQDKSGPCACKIELIKKFFLLAPQLIASCWKYCLMSLKLRDVRIQTDTMDGFGVSCRTTLKSGWGSIEYVEDVFRRGISSHAREQ
jgi:hypothetical protein